MLLPNKIYTYKQSIIPQMVVVLKEIEKAPCDVSALYDILHEHFENIGQYIETLDCLYALGRIDFNDSKGLYYVKIN